MASPAALTGPKQSAGQRPDDTFHKTSDQGSQDTGGWSDAADGGKVTWVVASWEQAGEDEGWETQRPAVGHAEQVG